MCCGVGWGVCVCETGRGGEGGQGRSHNEACVCPAVRRAGFGEHFGVHGRGRRAGFGEHFGVHTVKRRARTRATKECGGTGAVGQHRQGGGRGGLRTWALCLFQAAQERTPGARSPVGTVGL